ncbi:hypothetical protein L207DRAFT_257879 [Hyaloscypha variabilis F]|uniref:DUF676 domain-containing protein n=1 Tax=Hyaloscypha variabilis (strain UAMH 11265 / GT02V1 / F) TaxID=1149755 RepID=A0A2J6S4A2_HYAVF|nr:hypothetical protein L207DRAFT_257879 [Hyaloscypha variabilis F]
MKRLNDMLKSSISKESQTQDIAKVREAGGAETSSKIPVSVQQSSEPNAVQATASSISPSARPPIPETSRYNFKIVHDPLNPIVDILFLHGLTGDREKTWTRTKGKQSCFWPSDILPDDIPNARIAVWGYDASVVKKTPFAVVSTNTLDHHAQTLCSDIAALRGEKHKQPIIFIVHSLGGLVCKTALLHASEATTTARSHLYSVFTSTAGIAFLGTPHQGSPKASWGSMLASLLSYVKQDNPSIVQTLEKEAPHLNELQKRFLNMLEGRKQQGKPIEITCFFEELPMKVLGTIVPDQSATILGYEGIGIHEDHSGMTKFGSDDSEGYRRVLGEVKRWVGKIEVESGEVAVGGVAGGKEKEIQGKGSVTHHGNVESGGVGIYGEQRFQNSGVTNIGGVHTVHHAGKGDE